MKIRTISPTKSPCRPLVAALLGLVLATTACFEDDGGSSQGSSESTDPTAGTTEGASTTGDPSTTAGESDTTGSTTGPTTGATETGTTGLPETTGDTETGTTGEEVCQIELPDPGSCDGAAPAPSSKRPTLVLGERSAAASPPAPLGAQRAAANDCIFVDCDDDDPPITCDIYLQDCPEGEKCNPWAFDGGSSWNATKCVPIAEEPDPIGGPCTVVESGVSGRDSCEAGAMCWGVDSETGIGTCVAHCTCTSDNPICTAANTTCSISNGGVLNLCLPVCDPLDPDTCEEGDLCVAIGTYFTCVHDASGGEGAAGAPCNFLNTCNPGLACLNPDMVPGCQDAGCCAPLCALSDPSCPEGSICSPWYEEGAAPKCYEDTGICIAP